MTRNITLIPAWFLGAFLFAYGACWLLGWRDRRAVSGHWAERARMLWPARKTAGSNLVILPLFIGLLQFAIDGAFSAWCVAAAAAAWLGAVLGSYPFNQRIYPGLTHRQWFRLVVISWLWKMLYFGILIGGALLMPARFDWRSFVIAVAVLSFNVLSHKGLWRAIMAGAGILVAANERLAGIVEETASRMRVQKPIVWQADVRMANAMALAWTGELVFTTALMEICDDEEISSICAHEFAHLGESKGTLILRIVGSLSLFPLLFIRPATSSLGAPGIILLGVAGSVIAILARVLGRRMEKRADSVATEQQAAAGVYARAIEKIYQQNLIPAVMESRRQVHPHLYDRMLAAGIQPGFPRPKSPARISVAAFAMWIALGVVIGWAMAAVRT